MAATFKFARTYGNAPGTVSSLGVSGNLANFGRHTVAAASAYAAAPIPAGQRSLEVYLRGKFTGAFNKIDNFQFWRSTDFSPSTGLFIRWAPATPSAYATPTSALSKCVSAVPTSDPGTANVRINKALSGSLAASGYTDYIILQLATSSTAAAGDTSLATFTVNYDES